MAAVDVVGFVVVEFFGVVAIVVVVVVVEVPLNLCAMGAPVVGVA